MPQVSQQCAGLTEELQADLIDLAQSLAHSELMRYPESCRLTVNKRNDAFMDCKKLDIKHKMKIIEI